MESPLRANLCDIIYCTTRPDWIRKRIYSIMNGGTGNTNIYNTEQTTGVSVFVSERWYRRLAAEQAGITNFAANITMFYFTIFYVIPKRSDSFNCISKYYTQITKPLSLSAAITQKITKYIQCNFLCSVFIAYFFIPRLLFSVKIKLIPLLCTIKLYCFVFPGM